MSKGEGEGAQLSFGIVCAKKNTRSVTQIGMPQGEKDEGDHSVAAADGTVTVVGTAEHDNEQLTTNPTVNTNPSVE